MLEFPELNGIPEETRIRAGVCLEQLLVFHDTRNRLAPIISGVNYYTSISASDRIVTFSNVHETEAYKSAMLEDLEKLGYD